MNIIEYNKIFAIKFIQSSGREQMILKYSKFRVGLPLNHTETPLVSSSSYKLSD